jgi:predicted nucleic acid-binding protein
MWVKLDACIRRLVKFSLKIITKYLRKGLKNKIKPLDALHLSCAINATADYFITVDDGILKYNTNEITIFDPIMFIKHWETQER